MRIKHHAARLLLSRFIVAADNVIHDANYGKAARFGATRELQGIVRIALLAQLEGRPLNLSKLADAVEMPRATVERKLQTLIEFGMIERNGQRYQVPLSRLNDEETLAAVHRLIVMLHNTSQSLLNLPRMGTKELDDY